MAKFSIIPPIRWLMQTLIQCNAIIFVSLTLYIVVLLSVFPLMFFIKLNPIQVNIEGGGPS